MAQRPRHSSMQKHASPDDPFASMDGTPRQETEINPEDFTSQQVLLERQASETRRAMASLPRIRPEDLRRDRDGELTIPEELKAFTRKNGRDVFEHICSRKHRLVQGDGASKPGVLPRLATMRSLLDDTRDCEEEGSLAASCWQNATAHQQKAERQDPTRSGIANALTAAGGGTASLETVEEGTVMPTATRGSVSVEDFGVGHDSQRASSVSAGHVSVGRDSPHAVTPDATFDVNENEPLLRKTTGSSGLASGGHKASHGHGGSGSGRHHRNTCADLASVHREHRSSAHERQDTGLSFRRLVETVRQNPILGTIAGQNLPMPGPRNVLTQYSQFPPLPPQPDHATTTATGHASVAEPKPWNDGRRSTATGMSSTSGSVTNLGVLGSDQRYSPSRTVQHLQSYNQYGSHQLPRRSKYVDKDQASHLQLTSGRPSSSLMGAGMGVIGLGARVTILGQIDEQPQVSVAGATAAPTKASEQIAQAALHNIVSASTENITEMATIDEADVASDQPTPKHTGSSRRYSPTRETEVHMSPSSLGANVVPRQQPLKPAQTAQAFPSREKETAEALALWALRALRPTEMGNRGDLAGATSPDSVPLSGSGDDHIPRSPLSQLGHDGELRPVLEDLKASDTAYLGTHQLRDRPLHKRRRRVSRTLSEAKGPGETIPPAMTEEEEIVIDPAEVSYLANEVRGAYVRNEFGIDKIDVSDIPTSVIRPEDFLLKLLTAFLSFGLPVPRVGPTMERVAEALGVSMQMAIMSSTVIVSFGLGKDTEMVTLRVRSGFHAEKLQLVDQIANGLVEGDYGDPCNDTLGLFAAMVDLDAVIEKPPRFRKPFIFMMQAVLGFAGCLLFFRGGWEEASYAAGLNLIVAGLEMFCARHRRLNAAYELIAAFATSVVAHLILLLRMDAGLCSSAVIFTPLIWLLPSVGLTWGVIEISSQEILNGMVRLGASLLSAIFLGAGLQLGASLVGNGDMDHEGSCLGVSHYWDFATFPTVAVIIYLLVGAHPRQLLFMSLGGLPAILIPLFWTTAKSSFVVIVVASLAVGVLANLIGTFSLMPAILPSIGGVLLLVPSGLALCGVTATLNGHGSVSGMHFGEDLVTVASAIASGLYLSSVFDYSMLADVVDHINRRNQRYTAGT
eukprot:Clim_evm5s161 gene=Clim_evmTU5s161